MTMPTIRGARRADGAINPGPACISLAGTTERKRSTMTDAGHAAARRGRPDRSRLGAVVGALLALAGGLGLVGCASGPRLPPPPNLYVQSGHEVIPAVPPDRRTVAIDLLYATDREPVEGGEEENPRRYYDARRSNSLAVGRATVRLGEDLSWEDLVRESLEPTGSRVPLALTGVEELVRYPSSIWFPVRVDGELVDDPQILARLEAADEAVRAELRRRLATSERKEVFIYVHGVGNSFEDPMHRMAELWHFLGRPGVPIVYTWPALKGGGPLRGYTYARESSEFTEYHLRQFLQVLASCEEVERIHILAHSRGTGVVISVLQALRLIHFDDVAKARAELKLGNVILAAPDIDLQIAQQRIRPDQVPKIIERFTLYLSPEDEALGIAEFLFRGMARLGAAGEADVSPEQAAALHANLLGIDAIEVKVKKRGAHGHTYWIDNPAVLSDIILILRDDRDPGREQGRPMVRSESGLWEIHDGYPGAGVHAAPDAE